MKTEFRLRRRPESSATDALFLPGWTVKAMLELCASLGLDPEGHVFATSEGFLLNRAPGKGVSIPNAIRLLLLAQNLFIPSDADLIPSLLADEAQGLARDRGYIFLPCSRVVTFEPHAPLPLGSLIHVQTVKRGEWKPFPAPTRHFDRIVEIDIQIPLEPVPGITEELSDDQTEAADQPGMGKPQAPLRGAASFGIGRALMWLGNKLNAKGLAEKGARLANSGMEASREISQAVLGKQSAALRDLLREFREGNRENALRHAIRLGGSSSPRGGSRSDGTRLPERNLAYTLASILGPGSRGGGSIYWQSEDQILAELRREYQKAAAEATAAGDFRRAAYIQGALLGDYRAAAVALTLGGLHRDAAAVLLQRLNDHRGAAKAFESAGDLERAVALYRKAGEHESAGDLLRRLGDEQGARDEYRIAAEHLVRKSQDYLGAGKLMQGKGFDAKAALEYYATGWSQRPAGNAVACAQATILLQLDEGATALPRNLLDEVDLHLEPAGQIQQAESYYTFLRKLADRSELSAARADLNDRALIGLAKKLRQELEPGRSGQSAVSTLFATSSAWSAPLLVDANYAAKNAQDRPIPLQPKRGEEGRTFIHDGSVTAVASSWDTDEVFIGFDDGFIYGFRPSDSRLIRVTGAGSTVRGIVATSDSEVVVTLGSPQGDIGLLHTHARQADGSYKPGFSMTVADVSNAWLTSVLQRDALAIFGLWNGTALQIHEMGSLNSLEIQYLPHTEDSPVAVILLETEEPGRYCSVFYHNGREWVLQSEGPKPELTGLAWRPSNASTGSLDRVSISHLRSSSDSLEIAGLGPHGAIHWASFQVEPERLELLAFNSTDARMMYKALTLARPGLVAGIDDSSLTWLRCGANEFTRSSVRPFDLSTAIACVSSRGTSEVLVISQEGWLARFPFPVHESRS